MYKYNTDTFGTKSSSIRADSLFLAARVLAYREASRIYGKGVIIQSCIELYTINSGKPNEAGEFKCTIGVLDKDNKFTGYDIRFSVYKVI